MKKILLFLSLLTSCNLFEKEETLLAKHETSTGEKINILYVGLGATTNDVIQVREGSKESPIKVFENYNYLESSKLIDDTLLQLVLNDTGYFKNKPDTFFITLKEVSF